MVTLGVDTSNYATSLAVFNSAKGVVCAKKRFLPVKEGALGLRQSDAVFHHTTALPALLEEMRTEGVLTGIDAVGVSAAPRPQRGSYMPCFLAGVSVAQSFAAGAGVPCLQTTHQQGHIAAALYATGEESLWNQRSILFHISGGTTEMLLVEGTTVLEKLGESLDLYAGQAVDRLGVKLGFSFPAGPQVTRLALECGETIKPRVSLKGMDCHLSGLENQCDKLLKEGKSPAYAAKYCLAAIADTVAGMVEAARAAHGPLPVVCAGGVMSSEIVKERVQAAVQNAWFVPAQYASDNAIGVAIIAGKEAERLG